MGFKKDESLYVSGLVKMASTGSKYLGPSYVDAYCFDNKDYKKDFSSFFKIGDIKLEETTITDKDLFTKLFENEKVVESLIHWLNILDGKYTKIYSLEDESTIDSLSGFSGGLTMFYTVEEVYFLEYNSITIVLIVGNDE